MKVPALIALAIQSRSKIRSELGSGKPISNHALGFARCAGCLLQTVWDWTVLMNTVTVEDSGHT